MPKWTCLGLSEFSRLTGKSCRLINSDEDVCTWRNDCRGWKCNRNVVILWSKWLIYLVQQNIFPLLIFWIKSKNSDTTFTCFRHRKFLRVLRKNHTLVHPHGYACSQNNFRIGLKCNEYHSHTLVKMTDSSVSKRFLCLTYFLNPTSKWFSYFNMLLTLETFTPYTIKSDFGLFLRSAWCQSNFCIV